MSIPRGLGSTVSTRTLSWADLCHRAWGGEFYAPDHKVYQFSGRSYDSTDKGLTGIYGVVAPQPYLFDGMQYPDMRDGQLEGQGVNPLGSYGSGLGNYTEIGVEAGTVGLTNIQP